MPPQTHIHLYNYYKNIDFSFEIFYDFIEPSVDSFSKDDTRGMVAVLTSPSRTKNNNFLYMRARDSAYLCAFSFLFCFFGKQHKGKDKKK